MSKYLSSLLGSQNIKSILGTTVSGIKGVSGIEILHLPLGTILMYHGTGIPTPTTKTTEISVANGDSFDMKGWYVCNGYTITDYALGDATNLIDKFIRCEMEAGNTGGNNDAPYIAHSHTLVSSGGHTHPTGNQSTTHNHSFCNYWSTLGFGGLAPGGHYEVYLRANVEDAAHTHGTSSSGGAHSDHSMSNSGSSDYADKNAPYSRTLIFMERKRIDDYKLPLGTVMMYHGTAISNITGKGSDLSTELKMPGWYVANGIKAGTVNMTDKFARSKISVATGTIDGSDNVTLRQHLHTANANTTHTHTMDTKYHNHGFPMGLGGALWYVGSGGTYTGNLYPGAILGWDATATKTSYSGDHTHTTNNCTSHYHTISNEGDNSGVGYNIPAYKTLIFIQKVEA